MSRSLVDQLIAGIGILCLGFGFGCSVAGFYIHVETIDYAAATPPDWVGTVQAFSWAGYIAYGLAALAIIVREYRRRTATDPSTKPR
jgi:hypothetical protein